MTENFVRYDPSDSNEVFTAKAFGLELPPKPKWKCRVMPDGGMDLYLPTAPNAFNRLMQRLILGFKWERQP